MSLYVCTICVAWRSADLDLKIANFDDLACVDLDIRLASACFSKNAEYPWAEMFEFSRTGDVVRVDVSVR